MKVLSRPCVMLYSITLFALFHLQLNEGHHVIFENIGQMAGALSYIHVKLTVNISSAENHLHRYATLLKQLHANATRFNPELQHNDIWYQENFRLLLGENKKMTLKIIEQHLANLADMEFQIRSLREMMPDIPETKTNLVQQRMTRGTASNHTWNGPKLKVRVPKFLNFLNLPLGIFGTFMGLYTQAQVDQLRKELHSTIAQHNRLVEVVQGHEILITELENNMRNLTAVLATLTTHNPAVISTRLSWIERQLGNRLQVLTHALQQAQHRRLAVDLLTSNQLKQLYTKIQEQALENGCTLLTIHHSDLFQLETSYFYDGSDVHLLLHVPMVPNDSLLRLFKLHPFPLPLSGSHALIPSVKSSILALSSGFKRYSAQLSSSDLLGCHVVNNIYLCERHGVLNTNLNSTCLGALYQQDFEAVKILCQLEIHKTGEIVHQLLNNWYLTYSPLTQTVPVDCHNGTQSEIYIPKGITKFYLSPGCRAHLKQHLIISDISIKLASDILHFEWRWDDVALNDLDPTLLSPRLALLEEHGIHRPTLSDLQQMKVEMTRSPGWWAAIVNFTGNLVLFLLFVSLVIFIIYRIYKLKKANRNPNITEEIPLAENS